MAFRTYFIWVKITILGGLQIHKNLATFDVDVSTYSGDPKDGFLNNETIWNTDFSNPQFR